MTDLLIDDIEIGSISGLEQVASPALLLFEERLDSNLQEMIRIAGDASRLRPHCKTHKLAQVIEREQGLGIDKHKCATIAEAEMLADCGVNDVFWAYPPIGPNIDRLLQLQQRFPDTRFSVTADDVGLLGQLSDAASAKQQIIQVILDVDAGMHRTGVESNEVAVELYQALDRLPGLAPSGLHLYDGHNRHADYEQRRAAVHEGWSKAVALADSLQQLGLPVERIVAGGTGSFPCFAEIEDERLELSPGTVVLHDAGYTRAFPDLNFQPAAWLLTRVISRPSAHRLTLDLGHKACAADPPAGKRLYFPALPDAKEVMHNEEHLVLEVESPVDYSVGDSLLAVPTHICPTSSAHQEFVVVRSGRVAERWPVTARDRRLTI